MPDLQSIKHDRDDRRLKMVLTIETESRLLIFKNVTRIIRTRSDYISFVVDGDERKRFSGEMIAIDIIYDPERCERITKGNEKNPEIIDLTLWDKLKRRFNNG